MKYFILVNLVLSLIHIYEAKAKYDVEKAAYDKNLELYNAKKTAYEADLETKQAIEKYNADAKAKYLSLIHI